MQGGKRHPRDQWPSSQLARLRVELKDRASGALAVAGIGSKEALLRAAAPHIAGLPNRLARIQHFARQRELALAQQAAAAKAAVAGGGGGGGSGSGGKKAPAGGADKAGAAGAAGGKGAAAKKKK